MRTEAFADADLTCDDFLGGRVRLYQPRHGYRAGVDPVLLAASVVAKPGQSVLELGCGAAPALCCLGVRISGLTLVGLELQPGYAALAERNLALNGQTAQVIRADLRDPPAELRQLSFDHVIANPPYFEPNRGSAADDTDRQLALAGATPLADWVALAAKRLKPRGHATFIQRAERLPELLCAFDAHLGSLELMPLFPRQNRQPRLVLVRGRKEGNSPFCYHAGLRLHDNSEHLGDFEDYSTTAKGILRDGDALTFA